MIFCQKVSDDDLHERSKLLKRFNVMHKNIILLVSFLNLIRW